MVSSRPPSLPSLLAALLLPVPVRSDLLGSLFHRAAPAGTRQGTLCSFCADGVTAGDDVVVAEEGGVGATCAAAAEYPLDLESCADLQGYEPLCCPTAVENPCRLCANGITSGKGFVVLQEGDAVTTCADAVHYAAFFETASETCAAIQGVEALCCPTPAEEPCAICADGITAGEDFVVSEEGGEVITCADVVEYVAFFEATSETCLGIREIEDACCPAPAPGRNTALPHAEGRSRRGGSDRPCKDASRESGRPCKARTREQGRDREHRIGRKTREAPRGEHIRDDRSSHERSEGGKINLKYSEIEQSRVQQIGGFDVQRS